MAKSFHTIIEDGSFEVKHTPCTIVNGREVKGTTETVTLDLPEWLACANGKLDNTDMLLQWAIDHEIILPALQSAIQKVIIDLRASARPCTDSKTGASKSIVAEAKQAQDNIDNFVWKVVPRPGSTDKNKALLANALQNDREKMAENMRKAGIPEDKIQAILSA